MPSKRLLRLLNEVGFFTRDYADNVIIVIISHDQVIVSHLMKTVLSKVEKWCGGLKLFEKKKKVSKEPKYVAVVLDSKLNYSRHLEYSCRKVTQAYWACRRAFGST